MRKIFPTLLVVLLITATYIRIFPGISLAPIEKWDEQTNIEVVENSLSLGSFPVLLRENKPFFEKPPLWYILTMLVSFFSGDTVLSGRFVSAVAGFFIIIGTTLLSFRWWRAVAACVTWIVLISTNHLFVTNPGEIFSTHTLRSADVDSLHIALLLVALGAAVEITKHKSMPLVLGLSTALSTLAKSPLGLLPLLLLSIYALWKRNQGLKKKLTRSWKITLAVLLPWYVYMILFFGQDFILTHIGYHLIERTAAPIEGHGQPLWFYGQILHNQTIFLWGEVLVASVAGAIFFMKKNEITLLFTWLMVILCFIIPTILQTKLAWYILPLYPFAALLIGATVSLSLHFVLTKKKKESIVLS